MMPLTIFLKMHLHVLTATNVLEDDPRHAHITRIGELTLVPGYGGEGQRFAPEEL